MNATTDGTLVEYVLERDDDDVEQAPLPRTRRRTARRVTPVTQSYEAHLPPRVRDRQIAEAELEWESLDGALDED